MGGLLKALEWVYLDNLPRFNTPNITNYWLQLQISLRFMRFRLLIFHNNLWVDGVVVTHQFTKHWRSLVQTQVDPLFCLKTQRTPSQAEDLQVLVGTRIEISTEICASILQYLIKPFLIPFYMERLWIGCDWFRRIEMKRPNKDKL